MMTMRWTEVTAMAIMTREMIDRKGRHNRTDLEKNTVCKSESGATTILLD